MLPSSANSTSACHGIRNLPLRRRMETVHEQLSEQFHEWERRGRGWQVFPQPVFPEPPFRPFLGHYIPRSDDIDDGRRPAVLSSFIRRLSKRLNTRPQPAPVVPEPE